MKKIPIDKIEDGMILEKPVMGTGGNVLLNEGVVLKASMIGRLKNWNIPSVSVQSDEEEVEEEAETVSIEYKTQQLDDTFADVMDNPIMKIVYDATKAHLENRE